MQYFDFGDSWYYDVKLSSIGDYKAGEPLVSFIKGERECPPEYCGGIWGYQELLSIYEKKKSRKPSETPSKRTVEPSQIFRLTEYKASRTQPSFGRQSA